MRMLSNLQNKFVIAIAVMLMAAPAFAQQLNADKKAAGMAVEEVADAPTSLDVNFQSAAKQAILLDFSSNSVIYEKEATTKMFPSSMTKVLTMYLVFDQLKKGHITMDTEFTVSQRGWKTGGSQMFLKIGDKVKVNDLIQGVTVQSGNDACVTLAEGISGSVENFVQDMNVIAKQLGMEDTHFVNPDGLPTEGHFTTAKDLSTVARRMITDFPEHFHFYSQREYTYGGITQHNRNKLLDVADLGVDGMKTGFTEMGGYGMIATGVHNNRRFIAVVNGLKTEKERLQAAADLLRYGYFNFKTIKLFSKFDPIEKVRIWGGKDDFVTVAANADVELLVKKNAADTSNFKMQVAMQEPWTAPIKKGTMMANLIVKDASGKVMGQYPLYATKDVTEASPIKKLMQKIKYLIKRHI